MSYVKTNWENLPSENTPIDADNLNKIEEGIYKAHQVSEENKTDISNLEQLAITPSASGTQIVARDSSNLPLKALTVYGRTEQDKTTGAQLLDASGYVTSQNSGVTIQYLEAEDCFLLNGTATANDIGTTLFFNHPATKGDTYTVSAYFLSGSVEAPSGLNAVAYFGANDEAGKSTNWQDVKLKNSNNSISKVCDYNYITSFWFFFYKDVVFNNYKVRIQLQKGKIALPYEPYTGGKPSPSPDYPQAIVSAGQKMNDGVVENVGIEVAVTGKNLLDVSQIESTEKVIVNSDGSITVKGYGVGANKTLKQLSPVLEIGQKYTLSMESTALKSICLYNANATTAADMWQSRKSKVITQDMLDADVLLYCGRDSSGNNIDATISAIQIEPGTAATSYEPYRPIQTATIASANGLPGIPVSSGGNYTDESGQQWVCDTIEYKDGQAVYVKRVWTKTFDGSERWYLYSTQGFEGFVADTVLPETMNRREGFCNLLTLDRPVKAVEGIWIGVNNKILYVHNSSFYDATLSDKGLANWKAYLTTHPMTVMTYLTTTAKMPLTDTEAAQLAALHTYKPTTTITNDAGVGMDMTYIADTKAYIDNKFAELQTAIATTNAQLI